MTGYLGCDIFWSQPPPTQHNRNAK